MRKKPTAFPVGLYGMLLFALCWLVLPTIFAPLERILVGGVCVVVRGVASLAGTPAEAASSDNAAESQLRQSLAARVHARALPDPAAAWITGLEPVHCAVVDVGKRLGGGGAPCELLLDHTYAELAGCRQLVTKGGALVGWLQRPGSGAAADDTSTDFARVVLPNHPLAPAMHAEATLAVGDPLRLVVRAALTADPAPLRVVLWDDPWRAARLEQAGAPVRTTVGATGGVVPAGLLLGATRIWGYPGVAGQAPLTLGVYVTPAVVPRALSHVVLWRAANSGAFGLDDVPARAVARYPGVLQELPGASHGRHLLITAANVVSGAAVVQRDHLLGVVRPLAFGSALMTSFAASRQPWNLLLLSDDEAQGPIEVQAVVVAADANQVHVRVVASVEAAAEALQLPQRTAGTLFTGSNGIHCPAGLQIGRYVVDPDDGAAIFVTVPVLSGSQTVEVLAAEGGS